LQDPVQTKQPKQRAKTGGTVIYANAFLEMTVQRLDGPETQAVWYPNGFENKWK